MNFLKPCELKQIFLRAVVPVGVYFEGYSKKHPFPFLFKTINVLHFCFVFVTILLLLKAKNLFFFGFLVISEIVFE